MPLLALLGPCLYEMTVACTRQQSLSAQVAKQTPHRFDSVLRVYKGTYHSSPCHPLPAFSTATACRPPSPLHPRYHQPGMSTNANKPTTLWVGKEKGVWKTLAVTPRGSSCPVPKKPLRQSYDFNAAVLGHGERSVSGCPPSSHQGKTSNQKQLDKNPPFVRPHTTYQHRNPANRPDIRTLAAVARDFAERDYPQLLGLSCNIVGSATPKESENQESDGASMDLEDLSDLTDLSSDDDSGSVY